MTLHFDVSDTSVVVQCSDCGTRQLVIGNKDDANRWASNHQRQQHPGDRKMNGQIMARMRRGKR